MRLQEKKVSGRQSVQRIMHKLLLSVLLAVLIVVVPKVAVAANSDFTSTQLRLPGASTFKTIISTSDGGFIAAGQNSTRILVKYDSNKNIIWQKEFGKFRTITGVYQIDSGYIVVGDNSSEGLVSKIDSNGSQVWIKNFGGRALDTFTGVVVKNDRDIYIVGKSNSTDSELLNLNKGSYDAVIVKYNMYGSTEWIKTFGGTKDDNFNAIQLLTDGSLVAVGESLSNDGDMSSDQSNSGTAIAIVYDEDGNVLKKNRFGGSAKETLIGVSRTTDGGFIAAGKATSSDGDLSGYTTDASGAALLIKYDANGTRQWIKLLNGEGIDSFNSVTQITTGNYIVVGNSNSMNGVFQNLNYGRNDGIITEIDDKGNLVRLGTEGGEGQEYFYTGAILKDGNTYVAGGDTSSGLDKSYLGSSTKEGFIHIFDLGIASKIPTFLLSTYNTTNKDVVVSINYPVGSFNPQYKIGLNGFWTNYMLPFEIKSNDVVYTHYTNSSGIQSEDFNYEITNIHKPKIPKPIITPNIQTATNDKVTISLNDNYEYKREYRIDGGEWIRYFNDDEISVYGNFLFEARSIDDLGNMSDISSYKINNIILPTDAIFSLSTTEPTNQDVKVTITYPENSYKKEFKLGDIDYWYSYVSTFPIGEDTTLYARSESILGIKSNISSVKIANIDKIPPGKPVITVDKTAPTNTDVTVTIKYAEDAVKKQYRVGGKQLDYTGPITIKDNDVIYAYSWDTVGNASGEVFYRIDNIDKTIPSRPTFEADTTYIQKGDVTVTIFFSKDTVLKEYRVNGGAWTEYQNPVIFTQNGKLEARGANKYNKMSDIGSYSVTNIDKVRPVKPTITADITTPTNKDVIVTVTASSFEPTDKLYVQKDHGQYIVYPMGSKFTFSVNGSIAAYIIDEAKNQSPTASYSVNWIYKTPPPKPQFTADIKTPTESEVNVTIQANVEDKYYYRKDQEEWSSYTRGTKIKFTSNGFIEAKSIDPAGNESPIGRYEVNNIDIIPPPVPVISLSTTKPAKGLTVTADFGGETRLYKSYRINSGQWDSFGDHIYLEENCFFEVKSTDLAGNSSIGSYNITNIDRVKPKLTRFDVSTEYPTPTKDNVIITLAYDEEVVTEYRNIKIQGDPFKAFSGPSLISENGNYEFRAIDLAGNVSKSKFFVVTNIDKTAPTDAIFKADNIYPTNKPVIVKIIFPPDAMFTEYKLGTGDKWLKMVGSYIEVTENTTVYARSKDQAGNISNVTSYTVSNIISDSSMVYKYNYNPINGRLESIEYPLGVIYKFVYDKNGNLISSQLQP
ncbi:hypothetical protein [Paenibacillus sp. FSL R7-0333]|uniref:hypothetical protein n=1 Tax=Paenibacillus sp. FSL R7-0333 TaxID=1926587 RepID=UPI00096D752C|nr:hypothetical protein BK146_09260 [Paenibacillus sp. FSL R7-0333]